MKKALIAAVVVVILAMAGIMVYLLLNNRNLEQEKMEMLELAELDKQEMENDYERLTLQYTEMMNSINNDSIIAQLTQEQMRTQKLLEELKNVKAADAREITRLKKELATVREVLRSYIRQVDSLNQVNQSLMAENDRVKDQLEQSNQANEGLRMEKQNLTEKVAIAAQLDATGITMTTLNKRQKTAKKMKDCKTIQVGFNIARNVTAQTGNRTLYADSRHIPLREPSAGVLDEESGGIYRRGSERTDLLAGQRIPGGRTVSRQHLCRRQHDWNKNIYL